MQEHLSILTKRSKNLFFASIPLLCMVMMTITSCEGCKSAGGSSETSKRVPPLQLEQVSYDQSNNKVIYRIHNNSDQELKDAKLHYAFLNVYDEKQPSATLNNRVGSTVDIPLIVPKGQSTDFSFDIDFKKHESTFFLFEVIGKEGKVKISRTDGFTNQAVLEGLLTRSDKAVEALHLAIIQGNEKPVMQLIAQGVDINAPNRSGWPPLYTAVYSGKKTIVDALLSKGADVKAKNKKQATPLHAASLNGHAEIVDQLLSKGADVNATDQHQCTPLHDAVKENYPQIVARLLAHQGIKLNEKDDEGKAPLHYAAKNGHMEIANQLLSKGADVNAKDDQERTPLHYAAKKGHVELVKQLLFKGTDANGKDQQGCTPLHLAADKGHEGVTVILIACPGLKVNEKDHDGFTALKYAQDSHHDTIEKLLAGLSKP